MALDQIDMEDYHYNDATGRLELDHSKDMSFLDHLEELRWHIIRALIAITVCFITLFIFKDFVFNKIVLGPKFIDFWSYKAACSFSHLIGLGERFCVSENAFNFKVIQIYMGEKFLTHIKVSFVLGFIFAFPYVFWEFWGFIKPGLYPKEQKAVRGIVFICSFLFLLGVAFGYFVISPFAINFLMTYDLSDILDQVSISSFVNYMVMFTLPAGLIFELPVIVYFLAKVGLITPKLMRTYRRHSIIGILVLAALITPPDVVTQFLIGIPLYILYELSIFICAREAKKYEDALNN